MIRIKNEDVESIYLLSTDEADSLPKYILANGEYWWLRSLGRYPYYAAFVYDDGSVSRIGYSVDDDAICVRPALKSNNLESLNLEIGETVRVLGLMAQYIGDNSFLLCKSIATQRFDQKFEDKLRLYETSQVKQFIEEWLEKKKTEEQDG